MQPDRFARKIAPILVFSDAARSRRLMRNPLGRRGKAEFVCNQAFASLRDCQACEPYLAFPLVWLFACGEQRRTDAGGI
jgi:hypothetical protein